MSLPSHNGSTHSERAWEWVDVCACVCEWVDACVCVCMGSQYLRRRCVGFRVGHNDRLGIRSRTQHNTHGSVTHIYTRYTVAQDTFIEHTDTWPLGPHGVWSVHQIYGWGGRWWSLVASVEILGCSEPWVYGTLGSFDSISTLGSSDVRVRMFVASRMILRLFLKSYGTLVAVSAPLVMPLCVCRGPLRGGGGLPMVFLGRRSRRGARS
jgi:hypothetical protein